MMLKNGQTCFKNLAGCLHRKIFYSMFNHFSASCMKGLITLKLNACFLTTLLLCHINLLILLIKLFFFRTSKYITSTYQLNTATMNGIRLILQIISHLCILLSFCMIISAITLPKWWRLNVKQGSNKDHINADIGLWERCHLFSGKLNNLGMLCLFTNC